MKKGRPNAVGVGTHFLGNPNRRQYRSVEFLPGLETDEGVLNLYRGPSIEPKAGDCSLFLEFLRDIICGGNADYVDYLLCTIAHMYQKPWEPPEVCVVLRGRQGVGKNFFVEHIGKIIADYFIVITNKKHLVGSFNRHLMDKLLVFADEAFYGNEKSYAGILKNLVTQAYMAVEPKGVDVFMAKKYFRLFMASNEDFVVPADIDDRRFFVLDVSVSRAKDHEYFAALDNEWKNGGCEAFYDLMLNRDIREFNHRNRPETPALYEQKLHTLGGAERVVYEMLASGQAPLGRSESVRFFIPTEELKEAHIRRGRDVSSRGLALELETIAVHEGSVRVLVRGVQMRGFWVPQLNECRQIWATAKRMKVEWPADDSKWIDSSYHSPI